MPTISVIVPVYNTEKYINRCIDSILAQTFTDFELILIDDGSTDRSSIICDEYEKKDSRIKALHQKNQGQAVARNNGLNWIFANSNSEWIAFVDSDDWIHYQYLESLYKVVQKYNTRISVCNYLRCIEALPDKEIVIKGELWEPEEFHCQCDGKATVVWGKLFARDSFLSIRFPEGRTYEDKATTYKLLFAEEKIIYIDSILYYYYQNPDSTTLSKWTPKLLGVFTALEEQIQFFETNSYAKAASHAKKEYVHKLHNVLQLIESEDDNYLKEKHVIKSKLRFALRNYNKEWNFKDNKWVYSVAWPKLMNCYWLLQAFKSKFKGAINNQK